MKRIPMEKSLIVRYLLGSLPEEDCRRFEENYLKDEALFNELLAAETELINRYILNELLPRERGQFENYFLRSLERRRRVELAGPLIKNTNEPGSSGKLSSANTTRRSIWQNLLAWLGFNRSFVSFA